MTNRSVKENMSPKTQEQFQEQREQKKMQILNAALKVIANHGYNGATISMIAKEAGISKGLLYTYYESKEQLLEALITFGMEKAAAFLEDPDAGNPDSKESFIAGIRKMIQLVLQESDFWRMYTTLILQPNMSAKIQPQAQKFMEQYLGIYMAYFEKKGSHNPMAEAMLFGAVLDGLMVDLLVAPDQYPFEAVMEMIIEKFA